MKWNKPTKTELFWASPFILGIAIFLAWIYFSASTPLRAAQNQELLNIEQAKDRICSVEPAICYSIGKEKIQFIVKEYHAALNIEHLIYPKVDGRTIPTGEAFDILLSRYAFEDITALSLLLYHELRHVTDSDFDLYDGSTENEKAVCEDHNKIKKFSIDFAAKYDQKYQPVNRTAKYYASLRGNTPRKCK